LSSSEESIARLAEDARALLPAEGGGEAVDQVALSRLLAVAVQLYARLSAAPYGDEALAGLDVTPTEACTVAAALLRAQALSPFEFSAWFAATAPSEGG
jgi:hypothetical protein